MVAILARMEIAGHEAGLPPTIFWVASYEHLRGRIPGTRRRRQVIRETKERDNRSVHSAGPNSVAPCIRGGAVILLLSFSQNHVRRGKRSRENELCILSSIAILLVISQKHVRREKEHTKNKLCILSIIVTLLWSFRRSMSAWKKSTRKQMMHYFDHCNLVLVISQNHVSREKEHTCVPIASSNVHLVCFYCAMQ